MTVALVTGAGGFIGSHFAPYLAGLGWQVRAVDVHAPPQPLAPGVDFRVLDIRDADSMTAVLDGVDFVFNLASVHLDVHSPG